MNDEIINVNGSSLRGLSMEQVFAFVLFSPNNRYLHDVHGDCLLYYFHQTIVIYILYSLLYYFHQTIVIYMIYNVHGDCRRGMF